jgi:hypothetical protein
MHPYLAGIPPSADVTPADVSAAKIQAAKAMDE